jgi:hypothetical protein
VFFVNEENGVLEKVEKDNDDTSKKNVLKIVSNTSSVAAGAKQGQILFQAKRHILDSHI